MKIILIQPKMNKRPMDTDLKTRMAPPLALLTLMSLTPDGHEVIMYNENVEKIDYHCGAEMVGITVTLDVVPRAVQIAEKYRRLGIPVVAGGIHVSSSPDECIRHFDAVCLGAAERVWTRIIEDVAQGRLQQVYDDMADFRGEEIVSPAYHKIDKSRYLYTNVVTASRGCPRKFTAGVL